MLANKNLYCTRVPVPVPQYQYCVLFVYVVSRYHEALDGAVVGVHEQGSQGAHLRRPVPAI